MYDRSMGPIYNIAMNLTYGLRKKKKGKYTNVLYCVMFEV